MGWRTEHSVLTGARALAVLAGLDAGLGWVPADGVSARLAAAIAAVALVVVVTGRRAGARAPAARPDLATTVALGVTVLAATGASCAPPEPGLDPAGTIWLVAALAVGVAMVLLAIPPHPKRAAGALEVAGRPRSSLSVLSS
jgi:hypothetical protein